MTTTPVRPPLSRRDQIWHACRQKSCCSSTLVTLTAADLRRLTDAFAATAASLVSAVDVEEDDPAGFRLTPAGPRHELVLRKSGPVDAWGAPCVFLVRTGNGHAVVGPVSPRRPAATPSPRR